MSYVVLRRLVLLSIPIVLGLVLATARWAAASALGMRGVTFLFGGAIEDPAAAARWRRASVVLAGVFASYLVPASLFTVNLLTEGRDVVTTQVDVLPQQPAAEAGMAMGDRVLSVGGRRVTTWVDLTEAIRGHAGEPLEIVVRRGSDDVRLSVVPRGSPARIGVVALLSRERPPFLVAVGAGLRAPLQQLTSYVGAVGEIVAGGPELSSGPVGIMRLVPRYRGESLVGFLAGVSSFAWPIAALLAVVTAPRPRRRAPRP